MEIHSVQSRNIIEQMKQVTAGSVKREVAKPFQDPIREFSRAGQVEGIVRGWLTYSIDERKRLVRDSFRFIPRMLADERARRPEETETAFNSRQLERWRALCVVIQEESRAGDKGSPEVAIGALKQLFPNHDWAPKASAHEKGSKP